MAPESATPILPPELERQIFEICASSQFSVIPGLMLVAWRVKDWVEPLLYRTIMVCDIRRERYYFPRFTPETLAKLLLSKPAAFFRDSVRNLLIPAGRGHRDAIYAADRDLVHSVLAICTGVENLWAPGAGEGFRLPSRLPLKHLSTNPGPLFSTVSPLDPLFTRLTHLELTGHIHSVVEIASALPLLPQLSHLAFNDEDLTPTCPQFLEECASLTVLVSLNGSQLFLGSFFQEYEERLSKDVRFVLVRSWWFEDWQLGVHSGMGYWGRAEDFIAKRRSGEIP
ncbi:hypothetical protein C8R46DRAFT_1077909, partial [Mycena filopes]